MEATTKFKILLADANESELSKLASDFLNTGFTVTTTSQPKEVIVLIKRERPHLVMMDLVMPEIDGIDICMDIKRNKELAKTLVVFYSSREDDYSQIAAFDAGADDYITKPKQKRVLFCRIRALLKRYSSSESKKRIINTISSSEIIIDKERFLVIKKGEKITLPRKEFQLLIFMAETPKKVFSRKEISEYIWGDKHQAQKRTIDVHIRRLRKKIGVKYIETVKGVGYKLNL